MTGLPVSTLKFWRTKKASEDGVTGPRFALLGRRVMYRERDVRIWVDAQFEEVG